MIDPEHLHLLIHEEIYLINERKEEIEEVVNDTAMIPKHSEREEDTVEVVGKEELTIQEEETPQRVDETPTPEVSVERLSKHTVPLAIFHEATSDADLQLLQKIIDACKLENDSYEVYANGFNKEVTFEKAVVFVEKAKKFYSPIAYQQSQILCSKPLHLIANNQQEKAKLWGALKGFI